MVQSISDPVKVKWTVTAKYCGQLRYHKWDYFIRYCPSQKGAFRMLVLRRSVYKQELLQKVLYGRGGLSDSSIWGKNTGLGPRIVDTSHQTAPATLRSKQVPVIYMRWVEPLPSLKAICPSLGWGRHKQPLLPSQLPPPSGHVGLLTVTLTLHEAQSSCPCCPLVKSTPGQWQVPKTG